MPLILASSFLAGSLLSLLLPICLLIAIVIWYVSAVKRVPTGRKERPETPSLPADPNTGAADTPGTNP